MPSESALGMRGYLLRNRGLVFPVLMVASLLVLLAPLPPLVLDLLLACNITIAVVILLTTIYVERPLDFSVFPAILLGTTLARLVLNVASTRLILTRGGTQETDAAGGVIQAFGQFVSGDSVVVGGIVFAILVVIQFVVITKGATRISEVAARFALDGMPGKQMAIDADLNAGLITHQEASVRRQEIGDQADFYAAMDGAGKFVRGDAIAGLVITAINIAGGLYIGAVEHGMALADAVKVFTILTIGDGLVSQVPAFLISVAAGLIVTRTSSRSNLPRDVIGQVFHHPEAMLLAGLFLAVLSTTGLPAMPLLTMSLICSVIGWNLLRARNIEQAPAAGGEVQAAGARPEPKPEDHLAVDPLELELGIGLIRLADRASGGDLLERVTRLRQRIAQELGMILPKVRIRDNIRLNHRQYQLKVRGVAIASGEVHAEACMAIDTGSTRGSIPGIATTEPASGRAARWIEPELKERAERMGFRVVEPSEVVIAHLTDVVRDHAAELLTRQQVHQLLDNLKQASPKVVEELVPNVLRPSEVHQVLENLLRERVPIRDLETILETLGNYADWSRDVGVLTEYVRSALARTICEQYRDRHRVLRVLTLDAGLEDVLASGFEHGERGLVVRLSSDVIEAVNGALAKEVEHVVAAGHPPVVLCRPEVRAGLRRMTSSRIPKLAVLSLHEVTRDTEVESVAQVATETMNAMAT